MRRVLNQAANAAVKVKGSIFEIAYRRSVPRLGHNQAIGAIAHRQCRLIWMILHQGVRYQEHGPAVTKQSRQARTARMIRQLRTLCYRVELENPQSSNPAEGDFRPCSAHASETRHRPGLIPPYPRTILACMFHGQLDLRIAAGQLAATIHHAKRTFARSAYWLYAVRNHQHCRLRWRNIGTGPIASTSTVARFCTEYFSRLRDD